MSSIFDDMFPGLKSAIEFNGSPSIHVCFASNASELRKTDKMFNVACVLDRNVC